MTDTARSVGESSSAASARTDLLPVWLEAPDGVRHYLDSVATVGRAEGNDVRLTSPTVSRFHAMLRRIGGQWIVIDLDSRNGTRVGGERVTTPRGLRPGDSVQFGDTPFVLQATRTQETAQPTGIHFSVEAQRTDHFRLLMQPDSFAAQQWEVIGARLERCHAVIAAMFQFEQAPEPVSVYLLDQVADPELADQLLDNGGYARPERRLIYSVYRPESPGVTLERDLLEVMGTGIAGFARWPQTLKAGFLLFVTRRSDPGTAADEQWAPLVKALEQGAVPPLSQIISQAEPGDVQINTLAIANLLDYAAATYDLQAVAVFLAQITQTSIDEASSRAFKQPIRAVEKAWRKRLTSASLGGVRLFVSLLWPYLRPYRFKVIEIVVYIAISVAFGIILAKAEGFLVDKALLAGNFHVFYLIIGGLVAAFLVTSLTSLRENYVKAWVSAHLLSRIRLAMFQKVQSLEPGYFDRVDSGDLLTRLTSDIFMIESAISSGLVETIRFGLMFVVALIVIFFTAWQLALVTVIGIPLFVLVGRVLGRPVTRASIEVQTEISSVTTEIHENLGSQPVVKLFGLEQQATEKFTQKLDRFVRSSLRLQFLTGLYGFGSNAITSFIQLAVLGFGGYLVLRGNTTTGTLFAFMTLVGQIVSPMQMLSQFYQMVQTGSGSMKRINELLNTRPTIQDAPEARPIERLSRDIRLEHVVFAYDESRPILEDVNLTIPVGSNVAIVGPSGSGKSTVLNLLPRFYDPKYGRVLIDGVDLREATLSSIRGQIGMVFQESFLFNASIRENIRIGKPEATDAEVETAARAAELHDFIAQLPDGYDTIVGERGGHLSGGQRQRVAIARAILRNPALLLLDEATSALDPVTEAAITETLRHVAAGRTTISVTHRLASVVTADLIVVLDGGRLIEQGTHENLLRAGGLYARLWEEQQGHLPRPQLVGPGIDLAALQRIPLFSELDDEQLAKVASCLILEQAEAGSKIVTAGDPGDRLYLIKSGEVEVLTSDYEGQSRRLAVLGDGDYFGEIALLRDVPRTASVRACTSMELFSLSRERFQAVLLVLPALRESIMQTVARREEGLRAVAASGVSAA